MVIGAPTAILTAVIVALEGAGWSALTPTVCGLIVFTGWRTRVTWQADPASPRGDYRPAGLHPLLTAGTFLLLGVAAAVLGLVSGSTVDGSWRPDLILLNAAVAAEGSSILVVSRGLATFPWRLTPRRAASWFLIRCISLMLASGFVGFYSYAFVSLATMSF